MERIAEGKPYPLGASWSDGRWNVAVYSTRQLEAIVLGEYGSGAIVEAISLDERINKSGDIWHISILSDDDRLVWGWRLRDSSGIPASFIAPVLVDPYAQLLQTGNSFGDNKWPTALIGAVLSVADRRPLYKWKSAKASPLCPENLVIYEAHVRGMTKDPSSMVTNPGTYLGLIEKLPHLISLGITALELLPIFEFDETENIHLNPSTGSRLYNYWGYSPLSFFSPMQRYASSSDTVQASIEVKQLIDACHQHGIAVILDVVFNHTGEGNEQGPAYSMKALAESTYYLVDDKGSFMNFSGCGNTVNANHPIITEMIVDSLRHWVLEYRVDGFRFDLASALLRSQCGIPMEFSPLHDAVVHDPIVGNCILIAEPWDAAGLHQTGHFSLLTQKKEPSFMEWNDRFRDDVRDFIQGKKATSGRFATRLCGSQDTYRHFGSPDYSINFITAHDGFSLYDLVSFNQKHNFENGEENRDGMSDNHSWNCGHEGLDAPQPTEQLRRRQAKNFLVALLLSQGSPMLLMGDEVLASKNGNNNAWCHDTPMNWMDWDRIQTHEDILKIIRTLIRVRIASGCFTRKRFLRENDITWHGLELNHPRWDETNHLVSATLNDEMGQERLFLVFNAAAHKQTVAIPPVAVGSWQMIVNTSRLFPHDCYAIEEAPTVSRRSITLSPFSSLVLLRH